jgi:exodeoxyribonuclease VII small subunit
VSPHERCGEGARRPGSTDRAHRGIVARLEGDRLELDDALALFEEGVRHAREAERVLRATEMRIDRLVTEADGSITVERIPEPSE